MRNRALVLTLANLCRISTVLHNKARPCLINTKALIASSSSVHHFRSYLFICLLFFSGSLSADAQFLAIGSKHSYPYQEAAQILNDSCRAVSQRLEVPIPRPHVKLLLGRHRQTIQSTDGLHTIQLYRWNRKLFTLAAVAVCLRSAETPEFISDVANRFNLDMDTPQRPREGPR